MVAERRTLIIVNCKDNSKRVIRVEGMWSTEKASELGKDLEGSNYSSVETQSL